jgi:drug/metabolite transporter (DMT)-like permease
VDHSNNKDRILYGVSSWGTAAYLLFSVLATAHLKLPVSFVCGVRFVFGMVLTLCIGLAMTGNLRFCRTRALRAQLKRSTLLFFVTLSLVSASLVLKNVAMLNAYLFSLYAIAVLRAHVTGRQKIRAVGWFAIALCVAGVVLLYMASGSGKHPLLGLLLVLTGMYCQVLMMEQVAHLKEMGDSSLCTLFWSGVVGFAITCLYGLFMATGMGEATLHLPEIAAAAMLVLAGVTSSAVFPQWGIGKASERTSVTTLASAGLTQIVPAIIVQLYLDHWRLPSLWEVGGIVSLLASAWFGIKASKPVPATPR